MLGAIVLSEFNEIVHTFGNGEFRRFATHKTSYRTLKNVRRAMDTPHLDESLNKEGNISSSSSSSSSSASLALSSTSGVVSSSVDSLSTDTVHNCDTRNTDVATGKKTTIGTAAMASLRQKHGVKLNRSDFNAKCIRKYQIDRDCLLEHILPLVIIYRMNEESQDIGTTSRRERSGGGSRKSSSYDGWRHDSRLSSLFTARNDIYDAASHLVRAVEDNANDENYDSETQLFDAVAVAPLKFHFFIDDRKLRFRIAKYERAFIIVFICDTDYYSVTVAHFQRTVTRCLDFHYGFTIQLLNAGYSSVHAQQRKRAERRIEQLMSLTPYPLSNDAFNTNIIYGNGKGVDALMGLFHKLTMRIAETMGGKCRCIFVHCGQIISSICSEERAPALLEAYDAASILSLLEFALQDAYCTPSNINADVSNSIDPSSNDDTLTARHCLKCQVEQAWLRSRQLAGRQQYVNVHVFSLTAEVELICLSNPHFANVVSALSDVISHLNTVVDPLLSERASSCLDFKRYQTDCAHAISVGIKLFKKFFALVHDVKLPPKVTMAIFSKATHQQNTKYVYLTNLERAQKLIKNQWSRLCEQLTAHLRQQDFNEVRNMNARQPSNSSFSYYYCNLPVSMRAPRSSISLMSSTSSAVGGSSSNISACHVTNNDNDTAIYATSAGAASDETGFRSGASRRSGAARSSRRGMSSTTTTVISPQQLNAMMTQLRRVLRGLLNDLVACSYAMASSQQLQALHTVVRQSVDRQLTAQLSSLLASVVAAWQNGSPMRPLQLGLDALAYRVARTDLPFNYHFVPNEYRAIFSRLIASKIESDFVIARGDDGELLVQVAKSDESPHITTNLRKRIRFSRPIFSASTEKQINARTHATICIAIFPVYINVKLALRETYQLIAAFDAQIKDVARRIK